MGMGEHMLWEKGDIASTIRLHVPWHMAFVTGRCPGTHGRQVRAVSGTGGVAGAWGPRVDSSG